MISGITAAVVLIKMPNRALLSSVSTFCSSNEIPLHIIDALTPVDIGCSAVPHNHIYLGRSLTCVEIAIAHSHIKARDTALTLGLDVVIIMEDDADVLLNRNSLILQSMNFATIHSDRAVGVHLYPVQFGILSKTKSSKTLRRIILLPDFAVGYVLNRRSLKTWNPSSTRAKKWVADWPFSAYKIRWFAPIEPLLSHPLNDFSSSYAAVGRNERLTTETTWRRRMNIGTIRFLIFRFLSFFSKPIGLTPIPNENLRTRQITSKLDFLSNQRKK